jgi:hypothetical protein
VTEMPPPVSHNGLAALCWSASQRSVNAWPALSTAMHHLDLRGVPMIFWGSNELRAGCLVPNGSSPSA